MEDVDANDVLTECVSDCTCEDDVLKMLAVTLLIVGLFVDCTRTEGEYDFWYEIIVIKLALNAVPE